MKFSIKNVVLLVLMLISAALGAALRSTISLADERPPIDLETMVPTAFGNWQERPDSLARIIDPQQQMTIKRIYSQTLSRTYVNRQGYRIMLSIAYGRDQRDGVELHKPEVCYPAQGFTLLSKQNGVVDILGKPITATRLETNLGQRHEPITYWTVVGDYITVSAIDKKLAEMRYALHREIPDGMLVRISSIDNDTLGAFAVHNLFVTELIGAIATEHRKRFAGNPKFN